MKQKLFVIDPSKVASFQDVSLLLIAIGFAFQEDHPMIETIRHLLTEIELPQISPLMESDVNQSFYKGDGPDLESSLNQISTPSEGDVLKFS